MDTLNCMKALISLLGVILAVAFMASPAHAQSHENDRYQKLADDLKTPGLVVVTFDATGVTDEHYVGVDSNSNPIGPDSLFIWGSISKSFTSALAMMLAEQGKKVLLIDFDPQHNLSNYLNGDNTSISIADAIEQELKNIDNYSSELIQSYNENLDYISTSLTLSAIEMSLVMTSAREYILKDILNRLKVQERYDFVLIDCMPALNILLINALTAATTVLIPVEASYGAFEGLAQLFQYVDMVKKRLNRELKVEGILFTKVSNTNVSSEVREKLLEKYPTLLLNQEIKELTEVRKSYATRIPLQKMNKSRLAEDFKQLAKELLERGEC